MLGSWRKHQHGMKWRRRLGGLAAWRQKAGGVSGGGGSGAPITAWRRVSQRRRALLWRFAAASLSMGSIPAISENGAPYQRQLSGSESGGFISGFSWRSQLASNGGGIYHQKASAGGSQRKPSNNAALSSASIGSENHLKASWPAAPASFSRKQLLSKRN
jgi:hypothetical protein